MAVTTFKMELNHEIVKWCLETFGPKGPGLWDVHRNTAPGPDLLLKQYRFFKFYREEDALAFKLMWA